MKLPVRPSSSLSSSSKSKVSSLSSSSFLSDLSNLIDLGFVEKLFSALRLFPITAKIIN